jgi:hypothetical protein
MYPHPTDSLVREITFPTRVAYDTETFRPGCAIIQAQMGCPSHISQAFPTDTWITHPTDTIKVYPLDTMDQLDKLVAITRINNQQLKD